MTQELLDCLDAGLKMAETGESVGVHVKYTRGEKTLSFSLPISLCNGILSLQRPQDGRMDHNDDNCCMKLKT